MPGAEAGDVVLRYRVEEGLAKREGWMRVLRRVDVLPDWYLSRAREEHDTSGRTSIVASGRGLALSSQCISREEDVK